MDIPSGYHVNSNRPLEKFLIATQLQIEAPQGIRVGPIIYPRPLLRSLKFSKSKVSVFEGHTIMRFSVTVPRSRDVVERGIERGKKGNSGRGEKGKTQKQRGKGKGQRVKGNG